MDLLGFEYSQRQKGAPAQEEKVEMEKVCNKHQIRSLQGEPCGSCTADLRQLHRDAALAALSGLCRDGNFTEVEHVHHAIATADEFVRQHNPDAVIAQVVG